jgi:type III pantothenate kinase
VLAVDIGNSRISIGLVRGDRVRGVRHLPTRRRPRAELLRELRAALRPAGRAGVAGAVLCSVVPALRGSWRRAMALATGRPALAVGTDSAGAPPVRYRDRSTVGPDRLANAVAARALYGTPAIVVDFGTATNFDCVSRDGVFVGGVIAPGVTTAAEALYARAARLARVTLRPQRRTLGRSTEEALRAGIVHGAAAMVDGLVRRLARDMNARPHVIATGGLATVIAGECETLQHVDEGLTMKGMARIWEEQA